ncbi:unnamed protein product [Spirodela intermedia]|uniref:Uncharacterized protein n=1 Tax=Spirodela intermedia TaxID=51605 RepID=A0ABN7EAW4_SPIIN|nr:unnamed protein product [Spirodela intermedia]
MVINRFQGRSRPSELFCLYLLLPSSRERS